MSTMSKQEAYDFYASAALEAIIAKRPPSTSATPVTVLIATAVAKEAGAYAAAMMVERNDYATRILQGVP